MRISLAILIQCDDKVYLMPQKIQLHPMERRRQSTRFDFYSTMYFKQISIKIKSQKIKIIITLSNSDARSCDNNNFELHPTKSPAKMYPIDAKTLRKIMKFHLYFNVQFSMGKKFF